MNGSSDIVQPSPAHPTGAITTSTAALARYYRWHARLYDATRWSFLFGRAELIRVIADHHDPSNLLEVGCGTGTNLSRLGNQFPKAALTGLDLSEDMLTRARRKTSRRDISVTLLQGCYDRPLGSGAGCRATRFAARRTTGRGGFSRYPSGWLPTLDGV